MDFEEYWEQTRRRWEELAANPYEMAGSCGLCRFDTKLGGDEGAACEFCPAVRVYGDRGCDAVKACAGVFYNRYDHDASEEELRSLAEAVIQELDDRKEKLIAAMREIWEENCG